MLSTPSSAGPVASPPRPAPWLAAGAGGVVLVLLAGWLLVVSPQRTQAADLRDSTAQVESNEQALTARVTALQQENASLPQYRAQLETLRSQLPADAELPELVRSLRDAAARTGVQLTSLTPSPPVAVSAPATTVAAPVDTTTGTTAAPTDPAAATGDASSAATGAAAAASPVLQVPVTLTAAGGYAALMSFLAEVQRDQRLFLVTSADLSPATDSSTAGALVLSVTGAVFSLPVDTADAATAAAPQQAPVAPQTGVVDPAATTTN